MNSSSQDPRRGKIAILPSAGLVAVFRRAWHPVPPARPQIARGLDNLPLFERIAEVLRYALLCTEWAISRGGSLRAWTLLNLKLSILLAVPALVIGPVLLWIFGQVRDITRLLMQSGIYFLIFVCAIAAAAGIAMLTHFLVTSYLRLNARGGK